MKILASDFDGTFTQGGVGEEKLSAIKAWRKAGNKFGIISGRDVTFRQVLFQKYPKLELDFFASCNGAYIIDENDNVMYESRCNAISGFELAADLLHWGCKYVRILKSNHQICVIQNQEDRPSWALDKDVYSLVDLPEIDWFHQVSVYFTTVEEAIVMAEKIYRKYGKFTDMLCHLISYEKIGAIAERIAKSI